MAITYVNGDISADTTSVSSVTGLAWVSHNAADLAIVAWALLNTATPTLDAALTSSSNVVDTNVRGIIGTKSTAGSESGAFTLTCDAPSANRMAAALAIYRSCLLGQIVSLGEASGTAVTSHTCPTITPAVAGSGFVLVFVERVGSTVAPAGTPSGFTKRQEFSTGGTGGTSAVIYDDLSGTHGTSAFTPANIVSLTASTSAVVFLIELKPSTLSATLSLALETDAAQELASSKLATLSLSTETDAAVAVSASKAPALGLATETDSALAVAVSKAVALGLTTETESAPPIVASKAAVLALATETDAALAISPTKAVTFGVATETDVALPLVATRGAAALGLAAESDAAPTFSLTKLVTLGIATETDAVLPFSILSIVGTEFAVAIEADAAHGLTLSKQVVLGVATETDSAMTLADSKAINLGTAAEVDAAFALTVGAGPPAVPGHLVASVSQFLAATESSSVLTASTEPTSRLEASDGV